MILITYSPAMRVLQRSIFLHQSTYKRKKQMVQAIVDAIGPTLSRKTAGRAADLVIHFGVPWARIVKLIGAVRELRKAGLRARPGDIFEYDLRRIGEQYGVGWSDCYWRIGGAESPTNEGRN